MKNILLFFSLLALARCDKYDGSLSPSEELPVSATIHGQVAIDGVGLSNVDVNLYFFGMTSRQTRTNQDGKYSFIVGSVGDYVVSINNPNIYLYSFASNSKAINVLPKSDIEVNFSGTYIGDGGSVPQPPPVVNATVHGRVIVDGTGLANVNVAISLNGFYITKTSEGGYYTFTGLGVGDYVVFIVNPNKILYSFGSVSEAVTIRYSNDFEVNFVGMYIGAALPPEEPIPQPSPPEETKAVISGVVYQDANGNGWYDGGEIVFSGVTIGLSGGSEVRSTVTDSNGRYAFYKLLVGSYNVTAYGFESSRTQAVDIFDDNGTVFYVDFNAIR
ncbi:MAG: SdrD B-like domain-containing protein [Patescibacteria group bacterium]